MASPNKPSMASVRSYIVYLLLAASSFPLAHGSFLQGFWPRMLDEAEAPESSNPLLSSGKTRTIDLPYVSALDPQASSTHCNITGQCIPCTREQQGSEAACRATGFHQEITCIERFGGSEGNTASVATRKDSQSGSSSSTTRKNSTSNMLGDVNGSEGKLKEAEEDEEATQAKADAEKEELEEKSGGADKEASTTKKAGRSLREASADDKSDSSGEESGNSKAAASRSRHLEDAEGSEQGGHQPGHRTYVAFEACSPVEEETLSVFGFEAIMLSLLIVTAPVVYQRKRKAVAAIAMTRMPPSSRV